MKERLGYRIYPTPQEKKLGENVRRGETNS